MKLIELESMVKELYKFFKNQKVPEKDVLKLWLDKIDNVPSSAIDWILDHIKTTKSTLPTNLPRLIKDSFQQYIMLPEVTTKAEEFSAYDCPDCHGTGVLHFRAINPKTKIKYTNVAICNSCRASREKFGKIQHEGGKMARKSESGEWIHDGPYIPAMMKLTKTEISEKGWEFLEPENTFLEPLDKISNKEKYTVLVDARKQIRKLNYNSLLSYAAQLRQEGFTDYEVQKAVDLEVETKARQAQKSSNPGDIVKELLNI